jgi:rhodanese-related sulfurtransferase
LRPDEIPVLSAKEAAARLDDGDALLVDVREMNEYVALRVGGAVLVPISQFALRYRELPQDQPLLLFCRSGSRSATAAGFLLGHGYRDVHNVAGGILAWRGAGLPVSSGPLEPGEGSLPAEGQPPGAAPGPGVTTGS